MKDTITAIVKFPGKPSTTETFPNTLEAFQDIVNGYIETVTIGNNVIVCNEEGRINGMHFNVEIAGIQFFGPVIICSAKDCEFADVKVKSIEEVTL